MDERTTKSDPATDPRRAPDDIKTLRLKLLENKAAQIAVILATPSTSDAARKVYERKQASIAHKIATLQANLARTSSTSAAGGGAEETSKAERTTSTGKIQRILRKRLKHLLRCRRGHGHHGGGGGCDPAERQARAVARVGDRLAFVEAKLCREGLPDWKRERLEAKRARLAEHLAEQEKAAGGGDVGDAAAAGGLDRSARLAAKRARLTAKAAEAAAQLSQLDPKDGAKDDTKDGANEGAKEGKGEVKVEERRLRLSVRHFALSLKLARVAQALEWDKTGGEGKGKGLGKGFRAHAPLNRLLAHLGCGKGGKGKGGKGKGGKGEGFGKGHDDHHDHHHEEWAERGQGCMHAWESSEAWHHGNHGKGCGFGKGKGEHHHEWPGKGKGKGKVELHQHHHYEGHHGKGKGHGDHHHGKGKGDHHGKGKGDHHHHGKGMGKGHHGAWAEWEEAEAYAYIPSAEPATAAEPAAKPTSAAPGSDTEDAVPADICAAPTSAEAAAAVAGVLGVVAGSVNLHALTRVQRQRVLVALGVPLAAAGRLGRWDQVRAIADLASGADAAGIDSVAADAERAAAESTAAEVAAAQAAAAEAHVAAAQAGEDSEDSDDDEEDIDDEEEDDVVVEAEHEPHMGFSDEDDEYKVDLALAIALSLPLDPPLDSSLDFGDSEDECDSDK